ncbi:4Fe-4S dicluster domain-containing protein [Acidobacteriota bacterium]
MIVVGELVFAGLILFFLLFSFYNIREKENRAFRRSFSFLIFLILLYLFSLHTASNLKTYLFGSVFVLTMIGLFWVFLSLAPRRETLIVGKQHKIDERDVIFSRADYIEGTKIFDEYYKKRSVYKKKDDQIRRLPDILTHFHIKKDPVPFSLAKAEFDFLEHQLHLVNGKENSKKHRLSAYENTKMIKSVIRYLGAENCGICSLNQAYIYSHVGRGPEVYGQSIKNPHRFAIIFAVEMDYEMISAAPKAPVIVETGKRYVEAARISIISADLIRRLGYSARAHIAGSNYQAMLPPIAWEAGLGEIGRLGILITGKYGPCARLGLVTTELNLIPDKAKNLGIQDFCRKCHKCADNCPAKAIPYGDKKEENGVQKWVLNREKCYKYWRKVGTDCALCILACPFSKPDNFFHNLFRSVTAKSSAMQSLSIWGDQFFYGRPHQSRKQTFFH